MALRLTSGKSEKEGGYSGSAEVKVTNVNPVLTMVSGATREKKEAKVASEFTWSHFRRT